MKLHLPCRLRAAVMALFATAVISAPAYAADSPVYWKNIDTIKSSVGTAVPAEVPRTGGASGAFIYEGMKNVSLRTSWLMTVTGTAFRPDENPMGKQAGTLATTLIGFDGGDGTNDFYNSYYYGPTEPLKSGFVIGFDYESDDNALLLGTENGWVTLCDAVSGYGKDPYNFELTLSYTGTKLSVESVVINGQSYTVSTEAKGLTVTMPDASKVCPEGATWAVDCLTSLTATSPDKDGATPSSNLVLIASDGPEAWHVEGEADLWQWSLSEGYPGPDNAPTSLNKDQRIHFVSNTGWIVNNDYDIYPLNNKLSAGESRDNIGGGCSFGFKVAEGKSITVGDGCSADSGIFYHMSKDAAGLRISGNGNVIIVCTETNARTATMGATTIDGTGTLTIKNGTNTINMGDISAANASIVVDGDGALVIANNEGVNIKELTAKNVTIANGGTVSNLNTHQLTIEAGKFQAGNQDLNLNADGDMLTVGADATMIVTKNISLRNATIDGVLNSLNGTTSASNGSLTISGTANVNGLDAENEMVVTVSGGNLLAKDDIDAYKLTVSDGVVRANKIAVESDTLSASGASDVKATEVIAKKLTTDNITITPDSGTISLTNNVAITGSSVIAGAINNADIKITAPDALSRITAPAGTILATDTLTKANLNINGSTVISVIKKATSIAVNGQKTTANTIEADMVNTDGGHTIVANSIEADAITPNKQSYASQNAEMTGIRNLNNTLVDADTIKADYVGFGNIEVKNATVTGGELALTDATVLTNVDLKNSTITSHAGTVTLNEVKLGKNQAVGQTFTTLSDAGITSTGTPELVLKGSTTPNTLNLNFLTINDTEGAMDFTQGEAEYTIMEMGSAALDYAGYAEGERIVAPDVVLMNIASYTRSHVEIKTENGVTKLVLIGKEDKNGIVNELKQTDNQTAVMSVLDDVVKDGAISGTMKEIYDYVGNINLYTTEERQNMVSAASAASLTALAASQRDGIYESQKNLRNRIIQMGGITTGPTGNMDYVGLQAWIQADTGFNSIAATEDSAGYDYNTHGGTVGFNLNLAENLIVGAAFSASYGNLDARSKDKAEGTNDAYYLNLFARYQSNRWTHLFLFTAGFNEMEMERGITGKDFSGSQYVLDKQAKGSTDGYSLSAYYEGGYIFSLNEESSQILQPIVTLNLTSAHVNGYKEEGSLGNAGVEYEGVDSFYGQVGIGARYQAVIHTTEYERNAVLELRAQVVQNFGDTTDEAEVSFLGGGRTFTTKGTEVGTTGFQLGAGVSLPIGNQTTLFVDADADFRSEATSIHANLGLRYDF